MVEVKMPCLITCLGEMNEPRYMTPGGVINAYRNGNIKTWTRDDVTIDDSNIGLKGSPTQVFKSFPKALKQPGTVFELDPQESAEKVVEKLQEKFII